MDGPGIESRWGARFFRTCPDRSWGPPSPLYNGYRVFPGVKSGRGVTLTPISRNSDCAMGWTVRGSNPGRGRDFSAPVQTGPGAHPAPCTMGTVSFPGVKSGRGVTLTPHPLLVSWSRKSRAITLFPLWAVRPVQSLSACTRVHFTFLLHFYSSSGVPFYTTRSTKVIN